MAKPKVSTIWIKVGEEMVEARVTTEKDGFSASFPRYKGCFTEGDNLPHLVEMAKEAVELYKTPLPAWEDDIEGHKVDAAARKELGLPPLKYPSAGLGVVIKKPKAGKVPLAKPNVFYGGSTPAKVTTKGPKKAAKKKGGVKA